MSDDFKLGKQKYLKIFAAKPLGVRELSPHVIYLIDRRFCELYESIEVTSFV